MPDEQDEIEIRGAPAGVLVVDKPAGVTSRRVVDVVARALGTKTVGHAGTLDPLASGVVVVCVGPATRLVPFVQDLPKHYAGVFLLGRSSPSDDLETRVELESAPPRPPLEEVTVAAAAFRGEILQRPCDYSAVHVGGQRAYALARKGRAIELVPKRVVIDRLEITSYDWPRLTLDIVCSSGTFVRALGRDLAAALGTKAVMESLVRTAIGPFTRADALALDEVTPETARAALRPARAAVAHLPVAVLDAAQCDSAVRGGFVEVEAARGELDAIAAVDGAGELIGILTRHASGRLRMRPNFRGTG
jgi:tRNA pseudouridine55 synthase